jgi:hypothetical protein
MNRLPKGPIGFKVIGCGFEQGNYFLFCQVNTALMNFRWRLGKWFLETPVIDNILDPEEQDMLNTVWEGECKKLMTFEGAREFIKNFYQKQEEQKT